jgi:multiple sugar transport system permease protein
VTAIVRRRLPAADRRMRDRGGRFLVPALLILGLTSIYPTAYSAWMSLFDWNWGQRLNFVGLQNYLDLAASERFRTALWNTIVFTVGAVSVEVVLGLGLAVVVSTLSVGRGLIRTVLLVPLMVGGMIVSVIWKVMLDPTLGIIGTSLQALGLPPMGFLGDPGMAMASIIAIDTWWQTAFVFIVLAAGLQALPVEPFEAAEVDGASAFQRFRSLTLPLLRPTILVVLMFRTVDCLKVFAIIFGTTGGGPLTTTESVQVLAYRVAFKQLNMSMSMTTMVVFSVFALLVLVAFQRLLPSTSAAE